MKIKTTEKKLTFTVLVISITEMILFFVSEAAGTALLMALADKTGSYLLGLLAAVWFLFGGWITIMLVTKKVDIEVEEPSD